MECKAAFGWRTISIYTTGVLCYVCRHCVQVAPARSRHCREPRHRRSLRRGGGDNAACAGSCSDQQPPPAHAPAHANTSTHGPATVLTRPPQAAGGGSSSGLRLRHSEADTDGSRSNCCWTESERLPHRKLKSLRGKQKFLIDLIHSSTRWHMLLNKSFLSQPKKSLPVTNSPGSQSHLPSLTLAVSVTVTGHSLLWSRSTF